ncbi:MULTISPECIES: high-affinity branched-chain amino acid ABC transporter permease LivM [Rhizobium]|uniref:High-affinity branched-chain amino acid ABC transporter permease LivM n=1 Tax=Rhizobium rhododendri TaxID=2506430 RepID=A0ABY8IDG9_9HYPH|nr:MULTISPECIES: high-affinity branched-chain amino acid ABC transporter permease LivM [Rhizobium]MBO9099240.1 high-affinity branched-chain amino acid ABC transporter permease LivM [Rhizobium sp. L58/93]MBO9131954.1 high-affinity branched-chain amino acid ABC transporter permease LivM [Rhizobium sp. B209b/85]MBO9169502.1 high-affinity branched-chain amino acid ABC transporter permease LivM [Rhizobium sp. L245/93]MBO9185453.1 high-affinity branched-chain amino acid ABC transporter permease LivM 
MANATTDTGKTSSGLIRRGLIEAFFAALISFGMFVLYIGLKTDQNIHNELIIVQRWGLLAIFVAIAAVGRFAVIVFLRPHLDERKLSKARAGELAISTEKTFLQKHFLKAALVLMILYPMIVVGLVGAQGSLLYVDNFGIQILIYVMLAWGLNIVVGLAGLLDLGYVAFYAVGAYSYALLSTHFGLSFWLLLPLSGIFAALWGVILGFPVLRLRGDYLAIVTLAFGEIIRLVLINWTEVTKGTFGISGIPKATLFGIKFDATSTGFAKMFDLPISSAYYKIFLFYLILALCMLTAYVTIRLRRMPIGRAWEALREDEIACRSLGINTVTTKLTAFATGAMFGGFAGSFFAARQGFVSPESFVFLESAVILAIVVLGGMGSLTGIAIAAVVMVGGTEILRELDFLKAIFGPDFTPELYRMLLFGLAMVIVMLFKPRGFVGSRSPTAFLKESKSVSGSFTKEGHG